MIASIVRETLVKAIKLVQVAVDKKPLTPALKCILVQINRNTGEITLTGNNLVAAVKYSLDKEVKDADDGLIDSLMFGKIIEVMPEHEIINIGVEKKEEIRFQINCNRIYFDIHGLSAKQFPPLPEAKFQSELEIDFESFCGLIKKVILIDTETEIIDKDNDKEAYIKCENAVLSMYSKSSRSWIFPCASMNIENFCDMFVVKLPALALYEICKQKDKGTIRLSICEDHMVFTTKDFTFFSTAAYINTFPMPPLETFKEIITRVTVNRVELQHCVELAKTISDGKKSELFILLAKGKKLRVWSIYKYRLGVGCIDANIEGQKLKVWAQIDDFINILKNLNDEKIDICYSEGNRTATIIKNTGKDDRYYYVIGAWKYVKTDKKLAK